MGKGYMKDQIFFEVPVFKLEAPAFKIDYALFILENYWISDHIINSWVNWFATNQPLYS